MQEQVASKISITNYHELKVHESISKKMYDSIVNSVYVINKMTVNAALRMKAQENVINTETYSSKLTLKIQNCIRRLSDQNNMFS